MSRPREPDGTVSISIALLFLPRRMIEPLPKARSIWESAASSALVLSIDDPSTTRSAGELMRVSPYGRDSPDRQRSCRSGAFRSLYTICSSFAICSFFRGVLAPFAPLRSLLFLGLLWVSDGDQTLRLPARMPRFYFDISDDGRAERDHEGLEFDSLDKAREQAIK